MTIPAPGVARTVTRWGLLQHDDESNLAPPKQHRTPRGDTMDVIRGATRPKRRQWRWRPRTSLRLVGATVRRTSQTGEDLCLLVMIAGVSACAVAWLDFLGDWSLILR